MTRTRPSAAGIKGSASFTLDKHFSRLLLFCKQSTSKVICIVLQSTAIFNAGQVKDKLFFTPKNLVTINTLTEHHFARRGIIFQKVSLKLIFVYFLAE